MWETGECEEEWLSNRLKLVPKKGDLKILDNWRGIMLIESPSKILSAVMANRIQEQILEPEGLEEQNGFMRQGVAVMEFLLSRWHSKRDMNMDSVHGGYLSILSKLLTVSVVKDSSLCSRNSELLQEC